MNIQDEIRENQAARIRWLLERADWVTQIAFIEYVQDHPFPVENPAEEEAAT